MIEPFGGVGNEADEFWPWCMYQVRKSLSALLFECHVALVGNQAATVSFEQVFVHGPNGGFGKWRLGGMVQIADAFLGVGKLVAEFRATRREGCHVRFIYWVVLGNGCRWISCRLENCVAIIELG